MIVFLLSRMLFAWPDGAPKCSINPTKIENGMGSPSDISLGYALTVKATAPNTFNISISNVENRTDFQGILMYVTSNKNPGKHLGKFYFEDKLKWKYQSEANCESSNITGQPESTVTHSNPDRVPLSKAMFSWVGTPEEVLLDDLSLQAAVAATDRPGTRGTPRWQKVSSVQIKTV